MLYPSPLMRTRGFQILYWGFHGTAVIGLTEFGLQSGPAVTVSFQSGRYLHAVSGGEKKARQTSSGRADLRLSPFRNLPGSSLLHNFFHVPPSMAISARPLLARKKSGEYNSWVRSSIPDHPPPALGPLHVPPSNGDRRLITRIRREPDEYRTAYPERVQLFNSETGENH